MRKISRNNLIKRTTRILGDNSGASLVLVSILAIIVLTAVVVLRVTTNTYMASTNRQLNQDQAYELAASFGESLDLMIAKGKFDIDKANGDIYTSEENQFSGMPNASVVANVKDATGSEGKILTVTATVGEATYVYTKEYR